MRLLPLAGARRVAPFAVLVTGAAVLGPLGTVPLGLLASGGGLVAPAALLLAALLAQELCTALREPAGAAVARGIDGVLRARVRAATVAMPLERLESPLVQADVRLALHGHRGRTAGAAAVAAAGEAGRLASAVLGAAVLSAHVWWLGGAALVLALAQNRRIETMLVGPGGVESLADSAGQARRRRRADYLAGVAGGPGGVAKEIRVFGLESFFVARYVAAMRAYLAPQARGRRAVVRGTGGCWGCRRPPRAARSPCWAGRPGRGGWRRGRWRSAWWPPCWSSRTGPAATRCSTSRTAPSRSAPSTRLLAPVPAPPPAGHGGIDLTGVTFAYPHAAAPVLDRLDLRVRPGERLAVVGRNGAGKTTLVKLLTGLYTPRLGTATTCPAAVVFQDFVRYPLSLRDNVRLGDPSFEGTDADVLAALESAGALDLLNFLPGGLGTPLSRAFTGGRDLSGGQWQKVALARAVYAMNADPSRALIVDEPHRPPGRPRRAGGLRTAPGRHRGPHHGAHLASFRHRPAGRPDRGPGGRGDHRAGRPRRADGRGAAGTRTGTASRRTLITRDGR
ncbi:hypothetical protein GCM10020220_036710 [Nonomuraea rubra]